MKTKIRNSISGLLLIPLVLVCFALLPSVQAAPDPAPPPGANTRDGAGAMAHITTGQFNTAFGTNALNTLTIGNNNAAQGNSALFSNVSGSGNVAIGNLALRFNTDGFQNTAVGGNALNSNVHGDRNAALGYSALRSNTSDDNVAVGWQALVSNTSGLQNVAVGTNALASNTIGDFNTAVGDEALLANIGSGSNTAVGFSALAAANSGSNTAVGESALANTGGGNNIALGAGAGLNLNTNNNFNIDIGNPGVAADANTIRIGNTQTATFIAGISGAAATSGAAVFVTAAGKLGTVTSSARFKDAIRPMDKTSEAILALKPVTFRYKQNIDPTGTAQFGLVAEDVEKVNPDLVVRDDKGEIYTVRYEAVNAMLLNEFLKEHRTVQGQQKEIDALKAELKEQKALIQKVSDKAELNRPAPQTVLNNE